MRSSPAGRARLRLASTRKGELGWLTRGRMPPAFDNVAFTLDINKTSEPVKTKDGYELIRISEKRPEKERALDEVKENIKNSLLARKRNEKRRASNERRSFSMLGISSRQGAHQVAQKFTSTTRPR